MTKAEQRAALDKALAEIENALVVVKAVRADMHNRPPTSRAAPVAEPLTPTQRVAIWQLSKRGLAQQQIAAKLNVNIGRVSETLSGTRK